MKKFEASSEVMVSMLVFSFFRILINSRLDIMLYLMTSFCARFLLIDRLEWKLRYKRREGIFVCMFYSAIYVTEPIISHNFKKFSNVLFGIIISDKYVNF